VADDRLDFHTRDILRSFAALNNCRSRYNLSTMKYLTLAVLLAVMQTPASAPRKPANPQTRNTQNTESRQAQDKRQAPSDADAKQTIVVRESPSMPKAGKDPWDKAYVIFTGVLVIIGAVGVGCAIVTLWAVRAQVTVMAEQRQVMMGQLRTMQEQISEMSVQSGILQESVGVARSAAKAAQDGATAAKESADAAQRNIALVINKERARLRIEQPVPLPIKPNSNVVITYSLSYYGSTPAFGVDTEVNTLISESKDSPKDVHLKQRIIGLPAVVSAKDILPSYMSIVYNMGDAMKITLDDDIFRKLKEGKMFVHFWGFIKYLDFFDQPRETTFRYRWIPAGPRENWERWEKYGEPEDNRET